MDSDRWRLTKERLFQFTMSDEEFDNSYIDQLVSCLKDDLEALHLNGLVYISFHSLYSYSCIIVIVLF